MPSRNSSQVLSEEITEFISRRPHWIINWGSSILLSLVVLGLLGAWLIHYPDTMSLSAQLKATQVPKEIKTTASGWLISLLVNENAHVQQGQLIGVMETATQEEENLIAPQSGRIAFTVMLQEGQQLQKGQRLCYIVPDSNLFYAQIMIPAKDYRKIAIHQSVLLKLPAAVAGEQLVIKGNVGNLPKYPADSNYQVTVAITDTISTALQRKIELQEFQVEAEIITKEMRLLERLYSHIFKW